MMDRIAEASPRFKARAAGAFYLLTFVTEIFELVFVRGRLVISGDAAATATNILAHAPLFRLGFACNLLATACYVAVTALFYNLFKPVDRSLSVLAAFFSLVGCAMGAASCLFYLAPLGVLSGAQYLSVFKVEQLQALALMFLKLNVQTTQIGLVFLRILLSPDRLPHFQVDLPASNSGCADGGGRFGLADLSVAAARKVSVALRSGPRHRWGRIAHRVAPREGRQHSALERAGQRCGELAIAARHAPLTQSLAAEAYLRE